MSTSAGPSATSPRMRQRQDALVRANVARQTIADFLTHLLSLPRREAIAELCDLLEHAHNAGPLGAVRIERALLAVRGIGAGQVEKLLGVAEISHDRVRDLTRQQRELLADLLRAQA